jgi:phosphatidylglycerophosphate synthase
MSSRAVHLVIDARPRGPRGLLAAEVILGKSVLRHHLELAGALTSATAPVVVHAREEEHGQLRELIGSGHSAPVVFVNGAPRADASVLRTDRLYQPGRLRRRLRRGKSAESAVLWRLDQPESLQAADQELLRRLTYQPLGRYWAFPLAAKLAEALRPTAIRPNVLTILTALLMFTSAGLVASGATGWVSQTAVALALATALVLDTADGRLARLQGTSSALGRWLDEVLDELADMVFHCAIAWAAFCRAGQPLWLVLGIIYSQGKYLFLIQSLRGAELEGSRAWKGPSGGQRSRRPAAGLGRLFSRLAAALRLAGHADIRWHFWIVLALAGRLEIALAAYAAYYPMRALIGAARKGVRHA